MINSTAAIAFVVFFPLFFLPFSHWQISHSSLLSLFSHSFYGSLVLKGRINSLTFSAQYSGGFGLFFLFIRCFCGEKSEK
ncbi:MAG: hypothetical protein J3R72DRAFT_101167 [Linnemannia gamsii]|nr:MAG: hypothetical protein J3R72DRAFT_101167 [Linnemannia gamsii]